MWKSQEVSIIWKSVDQDQQYTSPLDWGSPSIKSIVSVHTRWGTGRGCNTHVGFNFFRLIALENLTFCPKRLYMRGQKKSRVIRCNVLRYPSWQELWTKAIIVPFSAESGGKKTFWLYQRGLSEISQGPRAYPAFTFSINGCISCLTVSSSLTSASRCILGKDNAQI